MVSRRDRYNPRKAAFHVLSLTMFGLIFAFPQGSSVFAMAQATAHGFQYVIITFLLTSAAGSVGRLKVQKDRQVAEAIPLHRTAKAIAAGLTLSVLFGWALWVAYGGTWSKALDEHFGTSLLFKWAEGFAIAALYAHFVVDAGSFRLSEKPPRQWMKTRLAFLGF